MTKNLIANHQDTGDVVSDTQWQSGQLSTDIDVIKLLEIRSKTKQAMDNFSLANAQLCNINLVNRSEKNGFHLTNCDLYHANMQEAHCFKINLSGSSLMKANFTNANLHCANLTDCNLLGTNFDGAKLENITWGKQILQERQAAQSDNPKERNDYLEQAEEIYRHLRLVSEKQGLFEAAGQFFQREMVMRRKQMPLFSLTRALSKIVDLFCGYGEVPIRVIGFTWVVITVFALLYFTSGIRAGDEIMIFSYQNEIDQNINNLLDCLYFSIVTFTTLGYGDITPIGFSRVLAAIEALFGSFTLALFVVVFVKKMTRYIDLQLKYNTL